jgi:hypothetical protein
MTISLYHSVFIEDIVKKFFSIYFLHHILVYFLRAKVTILSFEK